MDPANPRGGNGRGERPPRLHPYNRLLTARHVFILRNGRAAENRLVGKRGRPLELGIAAANAPIGLTRAYQNWAGRVSLGRLLWSQVVSR